MSFQQVIVEGYLGHKPKLYGGEGRTPMAALSVATNEIWRDRHSGERHETTEWHAVKIFGKAAESAMRHLNRGDGVLIVGKLRTRPYTDKNKVQRAITEVVSTSWQFAAATRNGSEPSESGVAPDYLDDSPEAASEPDASDARYPV